MLVLSVEAATIRRLQVEQSGVMSAGGNEFLSYQGEEVWSKLDADTLRQMASATPGGRYLNVATGAIDLGDIYSRLISTADQRLFETELVEIYDEKFQIPLAIGFLLLCLEAALANGASRRNRESRT